MNEEHDPGCPKRADRTPVALAEMARIVTRRFGIGSTHCRCGGYEDERLYIFVTCMGGVYVDSQREHNSHLAVTRDGLVLRYAPGPWTEQLAALADAAVELHPAVRVEGVEDRVAAAREYAIRGGKAVGR